MFARWFAYLIATLLLFSASAFAERNVISQMECELELRAQLRATYARIETSQFNIHRGLDEYVTQLDSEGLTPIKEMIATLPNHAVWMDFGAGLAKAQRDFLHRNHGADGLRLVATSYARPAGITDAAALEADLQKFARDFQFIETGFIETAAQNSEHPIHDLKGKVNLLTDLMGPIAYSKDMNAVMNLIADLLQVGGRARVLLPEVLKIQYRGYAFSQAKTAALIAGASGGRLRLLEGATHEDGYYLATLEKVSSRKIEPAGRLVLTDFWDGRPPKRVFTVPD